MQPESDAVSVLSTAGGELCLRIFYDLLTHKFHSNASSNAELLAGGYQPPKAVKTGTSIVGIIYKDGVILGADTRATEGPIVSDKNCSKIHHLQKHI